MANTALSPFTVWSQNSEPKISQITAATNGRVDGQPQLVPEPADRTFIAVSPAMCEVRRQIEQLAAIDAAVLLVGESGTGKDLAARMIHRLSKRGSRGILTVNCTAAPVETLDGELFGCEQADHGAAHPAPSGKVQGAEGGTLLLDDVDGMPLAAQIRLLHFLQEGEFSRWDDTSAVRADVRVLATADADLRPLLRTGTFRPDLYYRLNVFAIHLPPLRERREDLPELLDHFMSVWAENYGRARLPITRRILDACSRYSWPGNLRELENFVKRYLILGEEERALDQLDAESIPEASAPQKQALPSTQDLCDLKSVVRGLKRDAERAAILSALERTGGNKQEAAGLLRISLRALHYKVRAYHIESRHGRAAETSENPEPLPLPRAVGESGSYERPRSGGGKLIPMSRTVR